MQKKDKKSNENYEIQKNLPFHFFFQPIIFFEQK